jgi:hypothetical protein
MATKDYTLQLGESCKVRGWFAGNTTLAFTGAVSESVFSIAVQLTNGYNSLSYNLYFPKTRKEIALPKGRLLIGAVTADKLSFR